MFRSCFLLLVLIAKEKGIKAEKLIRSWNWKTQSSYLVILRMSLSTKLGSTTRSSLYRLSILLPFLCFLFLAKERIKIPTWVTWVCLNQGFHFKPSSSLNVLMRDMICSRAGSLCFQKMTGGLNKTFLFLWATEDMSLMDISFREITQQSGKAWSTIRGNSLSGTGEILLVIKSTTFLLKQVSPLDIGRSRALLMLHCNCGLKALIMDKCSRELSYNLELRLEKMEELQKGREVII